LVDVEDSGLEGLVCSFCLRVEVLLWELVGGEAETLDTTDETIERST
jgi:hypothetical protein